MAGRKRSSGGLGGFALGFVLGMVLAGAGAVAYIRLGALHTAAAVAGRPLSYEKNATAPSPDAPAKHAIKTAPFGTSEDVFEAGAHVYVKQCAGCHGTPGHDGAFARYMNPASPQLWEKHGHGSAVGVSDEATGETYWKIANGIHQSGMPAYQHMLSETQMWQISLLLKSANQQLPDPVAKILSGLK